VTHVSEQGSNSRSLVSQGSSGLSSSPLSGSQKTRPPIGTHTETCPSGQKATSTPRWRVSLSPQTTTSVPGSAGLSSVQIGSKKNSAALTVTQFTFAALNGRSDRAADWPRHAPFGMPRVSHPKELAARSFSTTECRVDVSANVYSRVAQNPIYDPWMAVWLDRYVAGDRVQVWTEMVGMGPELRADNEGWAEARAVAGLTMQRARRNVEMLLERLPADGYVFAPGPGSVVFEPPAADIGGRLDELEVTVGLLPLALRAWFEHVGQVNLMGSHPSWEFEYTDPLVVEAPVEYVLSEFDAWNEDRGTEWDQGAFTVDLAPDYLHKADVSGGPPYGMAVPNAGVDGLLLREPHQTTFCNYLRITFSRAGFPGWDRGLHDGWATPNQPAPTALKRWASDLLPI
jgi:hypothetical protein